MKRHKEAVINYNIRPLDPLCDSEVALVASRMRETLGEVLGKERGDAMYTREWLEERVRFHLEPSRTAEVFLAEMDEQIVGHTIVREEQEKGEGYGLFSTIFVLPTHRRKDVARALVAQGESWMREQGLQRAATNTSSSNEKLIRLFEGQGYAIVLRVDQMVHLSRSL